MFSRWVIADTELGGVEMPAGSVVHLAIGAANRDPHAMGSARRVRHHPKDEAVVGFGQGAHICLGMHVARAEMTVAISALLDRLPNLRLDPDAEPAPLRRHVRAWGDRDTRPLRPSVKVSDDRTELHSHPTSRWSATITSLPTEKPAVRSATCGTACRRCC